MIWFVQLRFIIGLLPETDLQVKIKFKITIEEDEVYSIFTGKDLIECIKNKLSQI